MFKPGFKLPLSKTCQPWKIVSSSITVWLSFRENVVSDCFQGIFVVTCTLCAFISLVWLREQILHGGGPEWVVPDNNGILEGVRHVTYQ